MNIKKRGMIFTIVFFFIILSLCVSGNNQTSSEEDLDSEISQTEYSIDSTLEKFESETGAKKEIIQLKDYTEEINKQKSDLEGYKEEFEDIQTSETLTEEQKDGKYEELLYQIEALQDKVPITISLMEFFFDNYVDYSDIPDPTKFKSDIKEPRNYKIAIYEAQDLITVKGEAKSVNVMYLSGNEENFRLVKKTITSTGNLMAIVEVIPSTVSEFITRGETIDSKITKYPGTTTEIIYLLPGSDLLELKDTKTIAVPDLSGVEEGTPSVYCGDGECQYNLEYDIDESDPDSGYYCQEDCKKTEKPWWLIISLIIIAIVGVGYINFYKGPGNFKEVVNFISIKLFRRRLFTSKQDLATLSDYVKNSLKKDFKITQIKEVLLKKGWAEDQIEHIFKKLKK